MPRRHIDHRAKQAKEYIKKALTDKYLNADPTPTVGDEIDDYTDADLLRMRGEIRRDVNMKDDGSTKLYESLIGSLKPIRVDDKVKVDKKVDIDDDVRADDSRSNQSKTRYDRSMFYKSYQKTTNVEKTKPSYVKSNYVKFDDADSTKEETKAKVNYLKVEVDDDKVSKNCEQDRSGFDEKFVNSLTKDDNMSKLRRDKYESTSRRARHKRDYLRGDRDVLENSGSNNSVDYNLRKTKMPIVRGATIPFDESSVRDDIDDSSAAGSVGNLSHNNNLNDSSTSNETDVVASHTTMTNMFPIQGSAPDINSAQVSLLGTNNDDFVEKIILSREHVDVLKKVLQTAAIKSDDIVKTVVFLITKNAFYINVINSLNAMSITEVSSKNILVQRCAKFPFKDLSPMRLACNNFGNFIKCFTKADDHMSSMVIYIFKDGISFQCDLRMDVDKPGTKLIMYDINETYGLQEAPIKMSLVPQVHSSKCSEVYSFQLAELRAGISAVKKILPKTVSTLDLTFCSYKNDETIVLQCGINEQLKIPISTNVKMLHNKNIDKKNLTSITISAIELVKMPLLNKSDTKENIFVYLREDNDYVDFVFLTKMKSSIEVYTRIPIINASTGVF